MVKTLIALIVALTFVQAVDSPRADIAAGRVKATVHLPDAERGYYRATRFDWSGSLASLTWNGHNYFGVWFPRYDPKLNDSITGPVEEFVSGIGYDEAQVGEPFIRIGVGAVRKPQESAYRQFNTYDMVDGGKWTNVQSADRVEMLHEIGNTNGYAYRYRKVVRASGDTLVLEHSLLNTGTKPIKTSVYNHNFYMLDGQPTGPDTVVKFTFEPKAARSFNGLAEIRGTELVYLQELQDRQTVQSMLTGFGDTAKDFDIRVENRKTGAGVRQTGDRPLSQLNFWSPRTTVCPEPYVALDVAPGQESKWTISYEFYQLGK